MARRDSFVFYTSWLSGIEGFSVQEQAEIVFALMRYCAFEEEPDLSKAHILMAYMYAKPVIDKNNSIWLRNKRNSKNAGAPLGNQNAVKQLEDKPKSIESQSKVNRKTTEGQSKNNPYVDVYDDVDVDEDDDEKKEKDTLKCVGKEKAHAKRFVPPTVEEVAAYVKAKGYDVDAEAFVAFYESKGWKVGYQPMKSWKAATVTWMKKQRADGKVDRLEERKRTLVQDDSLMGRVNTWLIANAPYIVGHFETLLTVEQHKYLMETYGTRKVTDTIMDLENRHDMCDKYNNLNTTLIKWLESDGSSK